MKTKCIDFRTLKLHRNLKPIVFESVLHTMSTVSISRCTIEPSTFKYIELIQKGAYGQPDIMFAYDRPNFRQSGQLFLGQWNDGIVEAKT